MSTGDGPNDELILIICLLGNAKSEGIMNQLTCFGLGDIVEVNKHVQVEIVLRLQSTQQVVIVAER